MVLKYINKTFKEVENSLNAFRNKENFFQHNRNCHEQNEDVNKCLSKALSNWMFEQAGQTIVPNMPAIGLRIISSDEKCIASSTSCFINKKSQSNECEFFVSISPFFRIKKKKNPNEELIFASNIHPVDLGHLQNSLNPKSIYVKINDNIELAFNEKNVGPIIEL